VDAPGLTATDERGEVIWTPRADAFERCRMGDFARAAAPLSDRPLDTYDALLQWSLADLSGFWEAFASWAGVVWPERAERALPPDCRTPDPAVRWFEGATLNYAENALRACAGSDGPMVVGHSQTRPRVELTGRELMVEVARCRSGLVELGITRGDRVAAYLPNLPETLVLLLASASLGAILTTCAPEFGTRAVVDRWAQLEPSILVAIDGYRYGTKAIDRTAEVARITEALPSIDRLVTLPYLDAGARIEVRPSVATMTWADLLSSPGDEAMAFDPVPFDHPLYVLFTSGTTGLPKPIVHGHGGITLEHLKVLTLHHDLGARSRFQWFTTTGWMMWNYLVSALLTGAGVVTFDGDPTADDLDVLWRIAADERVDVAGFSAGFLMSCRKAGYEPGRAHDLTHLRQVGSTGSPLPPAGYRWIRDAVGGEVQPCSISGGTDVCTAFVGSAPSVPVRAGELSVRMLGCDVAAVDGSGHRCADGETGELVIDSPMPSMPVGFWGDAQGERHRAAYFSTFPGRWHHGDWITFFDDGACVISGRSDATLNRGGVRLGTADFYTVVEALPEVDDSLVVHLEDADGGPGTLVLFVSVANGEIGGSPLAHRIRDALRTELSPRHAPDLIAELPAIPRTLSGKKLEVPVKRMLLGEPADAVCTRGSLADPAALDAVTAWVEARAYDPVDG
jgi:acetoacetyl-CoA synthetase